MIFPPLLNKGDTIAIFAPSSQIDTTLQKQYIKGIKLIKSLGYDVLDTKLLNTPEEKAKQIHSLVNDSEIKALVALQGGDSCETVLPYLNFELIKKNPKIFMGFSDISVLLNAIAYKSGLITYLGPDLLWKFGKNFSSYDKERFIETLENGNNSIPGLDKWKLVKGNADSFCGQLWGGNLRCFMKLLNTPYLPRLKDGLLMIEDLKKDLNWMSSSLDKLERTGILSKLKGIIIGYNYKCSFNDSELFDLLIEKTKTYDLGIVKINDFGHNSVHAIFPIGATIKIDTKKQK